MALNKRTGVAGLRLPTLPSELGPLRDYLQSLTLVLDAQLRDMAIQVDRLSDGRLEGVANAVSAVPTTGVYAKGDFVAKLAPNFESSTAGLAPTYDSLGVAIQANAGYVHVGWVCVSEGSASAASFVQARFKTG